MKLPISTVGTATALLLILSFLGVSEALQARANQESPYDVQLATFPQQIGDWKGVDSDALSLRSQDILRLDQFLRRVYTNSKGESVFVYVGYWKKQSGEHQAAKHSPLMCLPANGWKISQPQPRTVELNPGSAHTARELVGKIKDNSVMFYYWFFSGEKNYLDETEALFHIMHETLFHARSDGGIVEISAEMNQSLSPDESEKAAQETLDSFTREFYPQLKQVVERKR
ncbi:MAG: EpsI family protein [Bdellovibrionota bacterium]